MPSLLSAQTFDIYEIPKLNGPITLDGNVDEPAWKAIEPLPLVTHWPSFGESVDLDQTQIRIAHDEDYLYVSCRCYGDPENISAPTYKRNQANMAMDGLAIILDTFNDNENGLMFNVTPSGSRMDGAISNDALDGNLNIFWDTIWEAEAVITDYGWTAEMRIPFSSLRFESEEGRVEMGLIAYRYSAHNVTLEIFPEVPPNWGLWSFVKPSQTQNIVLNNVESHTPVFITPYLLGGIQRQATLPEGDDGYRHDRELTYEAGLDLKIGITDNTTLDLTLNTDFAQVEADDQQVNLTRFSLFFPERRQFFLERAAVFDFTFGGSDRLFHSRRIGLHEGQPVRILGGARTISRTGGWDIGLLSMQTAHDQGLLSENHSVVRVRRQLFNPQSYAGGMLTSRIDENGNYNLSYGLDGIFNLWGDDFLNINLAQTTDSDPGASVISFQSMRLQADWERRSFDGFNYNFNYNYSGELYEPAMGFQLRRNYMRFGERISWGWTLGDDSSLQRIQASMNGSLYLSNEDRSLETSEFGPSVEITWKRGDFANAEFTYITEDIPQAFQLANDVEIPAGRYTFPETSLSYHTPRGESLRAIFRAGGGGFFDGTRFTASVTPTWDPARIVNLNLFYQFNRIEFSERNQDLTAHVARFRTEFTFSTSLTFSSFVQFNSANDIGVINSRFRYNPKDGNNFYLVYNETLNADRDRLTPRLPASESRAVMLKFDYTF
ncbi:carbohydrate binding family 9 domain-containing protein [Rhodohalobacter sp. SW132]|uniref:carbohydrate binding family 9 domain-containing protein n=1 Tax=Rhodohalobacter sp. SW132 TaxID=2293433 RepID=UPI0011C03763|nr:carbohydrate binding family 9 domain-containing protein [Rhodohalobacter sp. SW132]